MAILLWLGGSALVAYFGRDRSVGPWGFLLFSLVFSPVVGLVSLLVAGSRQTVEPSEPQVVAAVRSLYAVTTRQQQMIDRLFQELQQARAERVAQQGSSAGTTIESGPASS